MSFITQGKTNWKFLLIVFILAVIVGGGILAYQYWWLPKHETKPAEITIKNQTAGWQVYRNEEYGFEVKCPKEWLTKEETMENKDSIKKKYRFDIYHPENINEAKIYGNIVVEFIDRNDNDKFFEFSLDMLKRDTTLTVEEITVNNVKGFKGTSFMRLEDAKSMYILEIFQKEKSQAMFRISAWAIDLGKTNYQNQANQILSTFKFIE